MSRIQKSKKSNKNQDGFLKLVENLDERKQELMLKTMLISKLYLEGTNCQFGQVNTKDMSMIIINSFNYICKLEDISITERLELLPVIMEEITYIHNIK